MLAIETRHLHKRFSSGHGVHGVALQVPAGSLFGFLGPNGAGKSTTIRLLLDLLRPDRGEVRLFGEALHRGERRALRHVGAMVEAPSLYPHLSGRDNLRVGATLLDVPRARADEVLQRVALQDAAARPVREYSLGMRQRLAIAQALLGRPRLLILDEPGNGLDPAGTADLRGLLRGLVNDDGLTVFLCSHLLGEVAQLASHVALLQAGQLRFQGTFAALQAQAAPRAWLQVDDPERARQVLLAHGIRSEREQDGLTLAATATPRAQINRWLVEAGLGVSQLREEPVSLEQLFFRLTADAAGAPVQVAA